ncbi:MAG: cyclic nucleotide-binding domain-containing protein [Candidatus Bipolaricaulia bacterium]
MANAQESIEGEDREQAFKQLQETTLFSDCGEVALHSFVLAAHQQTYEAETVIIKEGEAGLGFYLILDGRVAVKRKERLLVELGVGDFFGEMAILTRTPRFADVVALEPIRCLVWGRRAFREILTTYTEVALKLMEELALRLQRADEMIAG